jgi:hypothetical protein
MSTVIPMKGHAAPKSVRSSMETMLVSVDDVNQWRVPPFQRPVRVNAKVLGLAEELKHNGGVISGIVTLGRITSGGNVHYIVDGQHRLEAFRISELAEAIVDVRLCTFDSMAEMAEEFVRLNSSLAKIRPDDVLRGLEGSVPVLRKIREACPFVGYDQIRRGGASGAVLGMSSVIRCWAASATETPSAGAGNSAASVAESTDAKSAEDLCRFLNLAKIAWGRDPEYYRLWGSLNLTLCMWLYRRLVLDKERGVKRFVVLTNEEFKRCLMSLSADSNYLDWLGGRMIGDRDRAPAFTRIKTLFVDRLQQDLGKRPLMPLPVWATK